MGTTFTATSKAADAPDIEGGIYDARFDGIDTKLIKGGQYQKDPNGDPKFEWSFTLMEDGKVLYEEGEPVELSGLTGISTNIASKTTPAAVRYLKALMTAVEFSAFEAGEGVDAEALLGRIVQVEIVIKDNGWPTITNVLAAPRKRGKAAKAVVEEVDEE